MTIRSSAPACIALLGVLLTAAGCDSARSPPAVTPPAATVADVIYVGGDIVTINDSQPSVEALAVRDGRILALGTRADIEKANKGQATRVVDLAGKTLLPGFLDGHSHFFNSLLVAGQANLYPPPAGPGSDVPAIVAALKAFAAERRIPKGQMIVAYGYDDSVMPKGRTLNRDDLDGAFPDNPVRVDHVSMHGTVLNSLALKYYGYSAATKTPPGGVIVRKPGTQEPYGLIMEIAFLPVAEKQDAMSAEQEIEASKAGQLLYASYGITTAQDGATHLNQLEVLKRASDGGAQLIDVVVYPFITDLEKTLAAFPVTTWGRYDKGLKIGGVKITLDGSPQGRTAAFTTPYLTGGPAGQKNWKGELGFPQEQANQFFKQVYGLGVPVLVHANGDAAIDSLLRAHEFAAAGDLAKERNITAIHAQFIRKDQVQKFAEYRIRPSFYTLHTYYFAETHATNRGAEQASYISPMRDAIDAGLHPANHTDFVVAPLDQMFMLWSAVNRVSRAGAVIGAGQCVTPLEGLKAMTIWPAEMYGEQAAKGTLEAGKVADLVILDRNPLKVPKNNIKDIKVVETIKGGKSIYHAS